MAKNCEYCGSAFTKGANFCQSCGAPRNTSAENAQTTASAETTADQVDETIENTAEY